MCVTINATKLGKLVCDVKWFLSCLYCHVLFSAKNGKSPAAKKKEKVKEKKEDRPRASSKINATDIEVVSNNSSTAAVSN